MLTIWTDKNGGTREGKIARPGETIEGRAFKKDDESFFGGIIFGDLATSLVHALNTDRLFEVKPIGERAKIVLRGEIVGTKEGKVKEEKIYGSLWKSQKVQIVKELDVVPFLRSLASDHDFWVRKAVAENPRTELKDLQKLSSDPNGFVLIAVVSNPSTTDEILKKLCSCSDPVARAVAIRRSSLSFNELKDIEAREGDPIAELAIKSRIKFHRNTPILSRIGLVLAGW